MTVPKRVRARISTELKRYQKVFQAAKSRDVNESDTVVIIADFLSDVLGFRKYAEITTEFAIRGTYCDLAVKVGGRVQFLVEAKAIGISLKERHLRQATGYAATNGVDWVVLTNGARWNVYRMKFEKPISSDLVFELDLLSVSPRDPEVIERLYLLSKEGIAKSAIDEFQQQKDALNPVLVAATLRSDPLVSALRRELRRVSPGAKIDEQEIREVLTEEVIKRELVDSEEAKSASGRVRRAAATKLKKKPRIKRNEAQVLTRTTISDLPLGNEGG